MCRLRAIWCQLNSPYHCSPCSLRGREGSPPFLFWSSMHCSSCLTSSISGPDAASSVWTDRECCWRAGVWKKEKRQRSQKMQLKASLIIQVGLVTSWLGNGVAPNLHIQLAIIIWFSHMRTPISPALPPSYVNLWLTFMLRTRVVYHVPKHCTCSIKCCA